MDDSKIYTKEEAQELGLVVNIVYLELFSNSGTIFNYYDKCFKIAQKFILKYPPKDYNKEWGIENDYEETVIDFAKKYTKMIC